MKFTLFACAGFSFLTASPALAHLGHVADMAGHGHIVAIGATIAAAVLAGLVAKASKPSPETENTDESANETGAEPEAA